MSLPSPSNSESKSSVSEVSVESINVESAAVSSSPNSAKLSLLLSSVESLLEPLALFNSRKYSLAFSKP